MTRLVTVLFAAMFALHPATDSLSQPAVSANPNLTTSLLPSYLQEDFDIPGIPFGWTVRQLNGSIASWSVVIGTGTNPPIPPFSGAGQVKFNSYDAASGEQARLVSRRVNLSSAIEPYLAFYMYHDEEFPASDDSVYVEVTTGDSVAGPWTILKGIKRPRTQSGWGTESIPLFVYTGASRVFLGFRSVSRFGNNIYLDQVRVADSSFHDIGAETLFMFSVVPDDHAEIQPETHSASRLATRRDPPQVERETGSMASTVRFNISSPIDFRLVVRNFGSFAESSYTVRWKVNNEQQPDVQNSRVLAKNTQDTINLSWTAPIAGSHVVTAWTSLVSDINPSNDTTRLTVQVLDSSVIFFETFNSPTFPPPGWLVINRDGGLLTPWFRDSSTAFPAFEGAGFAADNFLRANNTYLDDYLITPPVASVGLPTMVDSLVFWCRSAFNAPPAANYPDSLMVLLSTGGVDTSSFTIMLGYFAVPKGMWVRKGYALHNRVPPGSTVRAAFRYLHFNGGSTGANSDFIGLDMVQFVRLQATSVQDPQLTPLTTTLLQNYPNPFNPETKIAFSIASKGHVLLEVFNVLGQHMETLVDAELEPGIHVVRWSPETTGSSAVSSGVYFYTLQFMGIRLSGKMILAR